MSNELVDEPMDAEAPEAPSAESGEGRASTEPAVPVLLPEEEEVEGDENEAAIAKTRQVMDLISNSLDNMRQERAKFEREASEDKNTVIVDEPAVDVEAISCCYADSAFLVRGRFIAKHCPPAAADMCIALINHYRSNTKDTHHYQTLFNELEARLAANPAAASLPIPVKDTKWIEDTVARWNVVLDGYQVDYKRHKDEGVKESTRRAMEDLFRHYVEAGKYEDAIRLYSRGIRDYCTQLKHSINTWLNWIEISIVCGEWGRLETVTSTAFRSLKEADESDKNSQSAPPRGENATYMVEREVSHLQQAATNKSLIETSLAKCQAAQVLCKLRQKQYAGVVETVLAINTDRLEPKWHATSSDLGIYALLCAMATMERAELKSLGGSGAFRKLLEAEPHFIELLASYTSSRFGRCFEIMFSVRNRLLLDPFISRAVDSLFNLIRQKCIVQYMQPYSTIRMETMCSALGTTLVELQKSLVELIETNKVSLRIDQSAGLIRMIDNTDEENTLKRVSETCDRAVLRAKSLLWKTTLAGANIHAISEKELRQKRKKEAARGAPAAAPGASASVESEDAPRAEAGQEELLVVYNRDKEQNLEDLGDI